MLITKCNECRHCGNYSMMAFVRNPHYCCELIWNLYEEDYKINPNMLDENCPLAVGIDMEKANRKAEKYVD